MTLSSSTRASAESSGRARPKESVAIGVSPAADSAVFSELKDAKVTPAGSDLMVLTYTVTGEQTCNGQKGPPTVTSLSVWQHKGNSWIAIAHSETPPNPPPKK